MEKQLLHLRRIFNELQVQPSKLTLHNVFVKYFLSEVILESLNNQ
jgi:hypothetical protein